jgi:glycosyltransferase involved in cell wall biosynthesis
MSDNPLASVIVPAKNEQEFIGECLDSLLNQNLNNEFYEIIVVDNMSTDRTADIARSRGVSVLTCDATTIGGVRNFGALNSAGEVLCYLDADCIAHPNWLQDCVRETMENSGVAIGGDALASPRGTWVERYWVFPPRRSPGESFTMNGSSMCFSRHLFNRVGGFDDAINSNEDTNFSKKLKAAGCSVNWRETANVVHNDYPQTIAQFFSRQVWLASSYTKVGFSNKDKVFFFVIAFIFGLVLGFYSLFRGDINIFLTSLVFLLSGPMLFSIKKITLSDSIKIVYWPVILALSLTYFLARSVGLIYSLSGARYIRR